MKSQATKGPERTVSIRAVLGQLNSGSGLLRPNASITPTPNPRTITALARIKLRIRPPHSPGETPSSPSTVRSRK